jgi:glycosyltransferase involved in cell wall biosynthesis
MEDLRIRIIIPAFNEETAIGKVLIEIPVELVTEVIVVDNASTDKTGKVAAENGATVLREKKPGYGNACLKGMNYIAQLSDKTDIVVFLDGDHSDYPDEMVNLVEPIINNVADLVIGSRALGTKEKGSMTPQQIFGNWLATTLMRWFYKVKFTDLGPFRAIRYQSLMDLEMRDKTYGWTVEMQLKAAKKKLRCIEVPVNYRRRIGVSKVSGTLKGTIMAGYKILWTIFKYL